MINKIVKKDFKSNLVPYIISSIAIILLTLVLTQGYPKFIDQFPQVVTYISILAGILLGLLAFTLLVYILINNFYTDKHLGYLNDVISMRKYLYYRIFYAFTSLFYFLFLALITVVVSSSFRWIDVLDFIDITVVVTVLNALLVYFCFFMSVFYKTRYNFKIPKSVIIISAILILGLLAALYIAVNVNFYAVMVATTINFIIAVLLILTNINTHKEGHFFIQPIEIILIILIIIIGISGIAFEKQTSADYNSGIEGSKEGEVYQETRSQPYTLYESKDTEYGHMIITSGAYTKYSLYINGELDISAEGDDTYVMVAIFNPLTGERITYDYTNSEIESSSFITSSLLNTEKNELEICSMDKTSSGATDLEAMLQESGCFTETQIKELITLNEFLINEIHQIQ